MRAVAVLMVFANHLFHWPTGGFVGVDVFFVLSGFFITGLLINERINTKKVSFQNFYVRRVKRILPSALLVLTVTVIGAFLLLPTVRARSTLVDALYAAVFASNFRFEAVGADYFQRDQPPSPLQHYWSLSIEEQFYFVWPAVLVAIFAMTRGLRHKGNPSAGQWGLFAVMSGIVLTSFGWAMYLSAENPNSAYFSSLTRVWELGVGALLAIAGPWLTNLPNAIRPVLAYVGLAGVLAALFLIDSGVQFPAPWAALPVLSTALVVASFHGAEVRGMQVLTNPVARWFGDTSYTLYLWHWPVITLLLAVVPEGPLFYGLAIGLSLGLTAITYRFYEDPIRKSPWLLDEPDRLTPRRLPTLNRPAWAAIGATAAAATVVAIATMHYNDKIAAARDLVTEGSPYASGAGKSSAAASTSAADPAADSNAAANPNTEAAPAGFAGSCVGAAAMKNPECKLRNPDIPLQPSIDQLNREGGSGFNNCFTPAHTPPLRTCTLGYSGPGATRLAITGDSHGMQLIKAIVPVLEANKWQLTTFMAAGCILMDPPRPDCDVVTSEIQSQIKAQSPFDLVLITGSRNNLPPERYERAMQSLIAAGNRIAVIADNPRTSTDFVECLTRASNGNGKVEDCGLPRAEALPPDPNALAAANIKGASIIDLTDYYCRADYCPAVIGDIIVYYDYHHLTVTFARTLSPALEAGIQNALKSPKP